METESLLISPLTRADYDWLCRLYADPEVMRYIGTGVRDFATASTVLDRMMVAPPPSGYWSLRDRASGEPLGGIMLMFRRPQSPLEIGFLLARPAWGRGLAAQAVRAVVEQAFAQQVPLIEAFTDTRNAASARVLLKAGFRDAGLSPGPYGTPDRKFICRRDEWQPGTSAL
jgi:ribosomal-protein-alanine N-acetyltransferase